MIQIIHHEGGAMLTAGPHQQGEVFNIRIGSDTSVSEVVSRTGLKRQTVQDMFDNGWGYYVMPDGADPGRWLLRDSMHLYSEFRDNTDTEEPSKD